MFKKAIAKYVTCIDIDNSRLCGILLKLSVDYTILVICVYMPCDNYSNTHVNDEYFEVMNSIEHVINTHSYNSVIVCGDFNTSFERNNAHYMYLTDFITRNQFKVCWDNPLVTKEHTYDNHALGHRSCIDHFIVSTNIFSAITESRVHHDVSNVSNHNVVSLTCACDVTNVTINTSRGA